MIKRLVFLCVALFSATQASAQNADIYRAQVQTMYVAYYGRPGDAGGIDFWANQLAGLGGNLSAIIDSFGNSEEFTTRFSSLATQELVNNIYQQLLGRDADAGGLAFFVGQLEAGAITLASVALDVANGAQNEDIDTLANKLSAANEFTAGYVNANVSYGTDQIEDARLYLGAVDSTAASLTAALDGLGHLLELFPSATAARVTLATTLGDIVLEMYEDDSPVTVANFLDYVDSDFYTDTWFHRILAGFVIQGGGFIQNSASPSELIARVTNPAIVNESSNGLSNARGSVAMARTLEPDSATSQFYINLTDNTSLDYTNGQQGYAVFAYVVSGMDTVDRIAQISTTSTGLPLTEIKVIAATRIAE